MNLRSRITLFALIPGILCSLLIGAYLSYALVRDIAEYENQMGNAYSEQIALQSFSFLQSANIPALQNTAQLALEYPLLRSITYYDARHQEIAHAGPRHKILTDDQASSTVFDTRTVKKETSENRQLYVPITQKRLTPTLINEATDSDPAAISPTIGWVRLEFSRSFMMLHKYRTMLIDTLVVGIVIAASFWIVMPFSDRLTRTVQQITRGARSISEDNGAIPLPTSNITELQELSDAISDMNNAIAEQQSGLQHHIEQSTQDLRETLETIEIQNIELDLARREAVQANRIKSEFLANTSHEIRTPLNSIIGFSKLLLKTPMSQQQQDFLQNIRKSSENLLTIINDVLDLSKIEAGKLVLDYIAFDLNETIEEILQILAHGAHEKGLELLHIIYSDVPRHLLGDPQRLKQILTNLISNAIKFSDNGNVVVRVSAENTEKNEVLLKIEVTDSGKGLPNGNQLIFNAFTQLDNSSTREYTGTGLGLAISRKIVEQMGGDISYNSEPGNTTFWFTVRFDIADASNTTNKYTALQGRHVLIFDSERLCRLTISHSLTDWGIQPVLTESIEQIIPALEHYSGSEHNIDAIIFGLPVNQEKQEFKKLLQYAQNLISNHHCPVVLCSPASARQELSQLNDKAFIALQKPTTESRLYEVLCQALDIHETPAEKIHDKKNKTTSNHFINILAVDDNSSNLKLISTMLRDLGVNVYEAASGEEALNIFRDHTVNMIFMDIQMPLMDGIETTKRIRQIESVTGKRIPIIALTAHALAEQKQHLLMAGLDDYLSKPTSDQQLLAMIDKWRRVPNSPKPVSLNHNNNAYRTKSGAAIKPETAIKLESCIDRSVALQATGNRIEVAIELLGMLLKTVEEDRQQINRAIENNNLVLAKDHIHKLHGSSCYCGVIELRNCCSAMETLITKDMTEHLPDVHVRFNQAVDILLMWQQENDPATFFYQTHRA